MRQGEKREKGGREMNSNVFLPLTVICILLMVGSAVVDITTPGSGVASIMDRPFALSNLGFGVIGLVLAFAGIITTKSNLRDLHRLRRIISANQIDFKEAHRLVESLGEPELEAAINHLEEEYEVKKTDG